MRALVATLALLVGLAGCGGTVDVARVGQVPLAVPSGKSFGPAPAPRTNRSNASIARDFMRLAFTLESGRELPVLSRFEGPIRVRLSGRSAQAVTERDLKLLLARLRDEAGIPISLANASDTADIHIELISQAALRRAVPQAACFVAPNVTGWGDFLANRQTSLQDWSQITVRRQMAIFIPSEVSAQEIRDCLHEELAQALGPVNDLYDLPDSVFNDDNFHTVLTGFDMAVLRAYYDGGLASGMSRDAVAARLPGILSRQRPGFDSRGTPPSLPGPTPDSWRGAIEAALGAQAPQGQRLAAARRALALAEEFGWQDTRMAFSLYAFGRLTLPVNQERAAIALSQAELLYAQRPETAIHRAHLAVQAAALSLSIGRFPEAIRIADLNAPIALEAQNAGLLATLLMIKSVALEQQGKDAEAEIVRVDGLGWARYAFTSEQEIRERLTDLRGLASRQRQGAGT